MFDAIFDALAGAIAFFYDVWPSYAGAIVLFTLAVMLVTTPLSIKSTRSMIRMQRVQPEIKRLQQQYKGDREALNREMMAFYQANNINPLSSCLPMLLQMPVFIILYQILSGLTRKGPDGQFDPKYLEPASALNQALEGSTKMMSVGMDLARSALAELQDDGVLGSFPYLLLIVAVVATSWYQQRQIAGRSENINPQQRMLGRIFPLMMIPITLSIPAGVVVYFLVSNVVRVGQQALITHLEYGEGKGTAIVTPPPSATPQKAATQAKPRPASGRVTPASGNRSKQRKRKRK